MGWAGDNMTYYKYNICIEVFSPHVEILQLNANDIIEYMISLFIDLYYAECQMDSELNKFLFQNLYCYRVTFGIHHYRSHGITEFPITVPHSRLEQYFWPLSMSYHIRHHARPFKDILT